MVGLFFNEFSWFPQYFPWLVEDLLRSCFEYSGLNTFVPWFYCRSKNDLYYSIPSGQYFIVDNVVNSSQWTFGSFWLNLMTGAIPSNNLAFYFFCSHTLLAIECVLPSPIKPLFFFSFFLAFWTYFDSLTHPQIFFFLYYGTFFCWILL